MLLLALGERGVFSDDYGVFADTWVSFFSFSSNFPYFLL